MEIRFDLRELDGLEVSQEKLDLLRASMGLADTDDLAPRLTNLAHAGLIEYLARISHEGIKESG